jgi:hypothetical protein
MCYSEITRAGKTYWMQNKIITGNLDRIMVYGEGSSTI